MHRAADIICASPSVDTEREVLLGRIAAEATQHPEDTQRSLIFLGDYFDRGASSRGVIERLLSDPLPGFTPGFETVRLLGNHGEALLHFLDERFGCPDSP